MGMYTELFVEGGLKAAAPQEIKNVIYYLFDQARDDHMKIQPIAWPDHPFFTLPRWASIGNCSSFYHVPLSMSTCDEQQGQLYFVSRSDLKNYDNEIAAFLDWLRPYCQTLRGWVLYEEDEAPTTFNHEDND